MKKQLVITFSDKKITKDGAYPARISRSWQVANKVFIEYVTLETGEAFTKVFDADMTEGTRLWDEVVTIVGKSLAELADGENFDMQKLAGLNCKLGLQRRTRVGGKESMTPGVVLAA